MGTVPLKAPCAGPWVTAKLKLPEAVSTSLPVKVIACGVSSVALTLWAVAVGGSLTGLTVILTVAGRLVRAGEVPSPVSVTVNLKLSAPL